MLNRFTTLADAVRAHEERMSSVAVERRPGDHELYRRLQEGEHRHSANGNG